MATMQMSLYYDNQLVPSNLSVLEKVNMVEDISVFNIKFLVNLVSTWAHNLLHNKSQWSTM